MSCQCTTKEKEENYLNDPVKLKEDNRTLKICTHRIKSLMATMNIECLENLIEQYWKIETNEQLSKEETENAINKLKKGKAVGPNKINNKMIKRCGKNET